MKTKDLQSSCVINGIKKSSKRKQRLYINCLKIEIKNETKYKNYKNSFEAIKEVLKKTFFQINTHLEKQY